MTAGYIYILRNPHYPNLLKIGKTQREPSERSQELSSSTGVPGSFEVIHCVEVHDCDSAEILVHKRLEKYRHKSGKEFFAISADQGIETINEIGVFF